LAKLMKANVITEEERRNMAQGNGGKLNPVWVAWLMGFPTDWLHLKDSATPKSRSAPPLRGKRCTKGAMKNE
jgi:hypothetical protein